MNETGCVKSSLKKMSTSKKSDNISPQNANYYQIFFKVIHKWYKVKHFRA